MSEWNDFLAEVKKAETELGNPKEIWYRGQSNKDWLLTPSLLRESDWQLKEKQLFIEFKKTASRLFEKRTSDWEILFDMQHYWIPTRLLDWTTVMGVAIAFILHNEYSTPEDSSLFILNPEALNRLSGRNEVINIPEDKGFDYQKVYWDNNPVRIDKPLAIRPGMITDRLQAQKGTFTVHGTLESGFETIGDEFIRKVILPSSAKVEAKNFLKWANLDEYTIYPDIVGMAQHIKRKILS
jgi:hypothetical protein